MGMYTEVYVKVTLVENCDPAVVGVLNYMVDDSRIPNTLPDHPLFKTARWHFMLRCSSHYHVPAVVGKFWFDDIANQWYLVSRSDFKNYENEVELFFDWIKPYVQTNYGDKTFVGYHLYEEFIEPTLVYIQ